MGTRSIIAMRNTDGQYQAIYCHWDGYLSNNGRILFEHYTDEAKVRELIALGSISSLRPLIGERHPFDTYDIPKDEIDPQWELWCKAYGRDRGETDVAAREFVSLQHLQNCMAEEFTYVYDAATGSWSVALNDSIKLTVLAEALGHGVPA